LTSFEMKIDCLRTHRAHHEISEIFHHRHSIDVQIIYAVNIRNTFQKKENILNIKHVLKYILKNVFQFSPLVPASISAAISLAASLGESAL